ncbi:hypothetical protein D9M70_430280 [compost metagenome]
MQCKMLDCFFRFTARAGVRLDIARVSDQCAKSQLLERHRSAPCWRRQLIVGESPAGVERHAERMNGPPVQQRLESDLRRDNEHGFRLPYQRDNVHVIPQPRHPRPLVLIENPAEVATFAPQRNLGMLLDDDLAVGIKLQRGIQHAPEAVAIRLPELHRGIISGLVNDQHIAIAPQGCRVGRVVVLRDSGTPPLFDQTQRSRLLRGGERHRDHVLKP